MSRTRCVLMILAGLFAASCTATETGFDKLAKDHRCKVRERAVAVDEATPLGFAAGEVFDRIAGEHDSTLDWRDGRPTTALFLDVDELGSPVLVDTVPANDLTAPTTCTDIKLVFDARLHLWTDDGTFDETWVQKAEATELSRFGAVHWLAAEEIGGSFEQAKVEMVGFQIEIRAPESDPAEAYLQGTIHLASQTDGQQEGLLSEDWAATISPGEGP
jgi:hypothetical protein